MHIGSSSPREHWLSREANRLHLAEGIRRNALHNLHVAFFLFCQVVEDAYKYSTDILIEEAAR